MVRSLAARPPPARPLKLCSNNLTWNLPSQKNVGVSALSIGQGPIRLNGYSILVNYVLYSRDFQWGTTTRLNGKSFITLTLKHVWVSNPKGSFGREDVQRISLFYRQEGQWEASLNCRASTCVQRLPFILLLEAFWCSTGELFRIYKILWLAWLTHNSSTSCWVNEIILRFDSSG